MAKINKTKKDEEIKEDVKPTKKTDKRKSKSVIRKELKKISKDVDVEVLNISNGAVIYSCKKTNETLTLDFTGDTSIVSLDFLMNMKNKGLLENLIIAVIDVFDEEDKYTIDDILLVLDLEDLYKQCDMKLESIDDILNKTTNDEFEKILNSSNVEFIERLVERAVLLSKKHEFDSIHKRTLLEKKVDNIFLFKSI